MNEKEVAEIRRRFRPDKSSITHIRGCYVNEQREVVSQFNQSLALMTQDEAERFLSILKRTLSGTLGKHLTDIPFTTQQVVHGQEHKLLMTLKNSALADEEAVQQFYQQVIQAVCLEGSYLILLAHDQYDVPFRGSDGDLQQDASSDVYAYLLCSVCPVKQAKPALSYFIRENEFHNRTMDWLVSNPELGFLFPAFEDRGSNIYQALYYSRDVTGLHSGFVKALFQQEPPMPAAVQQETFQSVLCGTLDEDCSFDLVQTMHDQMTGLIEEHKAAKEPEPLTITKGTVRRVLETCGVSQERVAAFDETFDREFGYETALSPKNIVNTRQIELTTPDVTIRVKPERGDLVETRVLGGAKYILIRVEDELALNGVPIQINE